MGRVRPKPKLSGLNQVPTRNKVPGFGSWVQSFQASWLLVSVPGFNSLEFTGNTKKIRPYSRPIPGSYWSNQEIPEFDQEYIRIDLGSAHTMLDVLILK